MRLKNQEEVRAKKEAKILAMAMEQKARAQAVKDGRAVPNVSTHSSGGYMGIPQATKSEGPKWGGHGKRRTREEKQDGKSGISQVNWQTLRRRNSLFIVVQIFTWDAHCYKDLTS